MLVNASGMAVGTMAALAGVAAGLAAFWGLGYVMAPIGGKREKRVAKLLFADGASFPPASGLFRPRPSPDWP